METPRGPTGRTAALSAAVALTALIGWRYGAILLDLESSFADFDALHAGRLLTEAADTRLNAWILDWVQRSALSAPAGVFDTNAFYPALGTLTGSEHLFGIALQTLPFRPLLSGAVALHQVALVLSTVVLAATSFLAVRGWTGSSAGGFAAAAAAVMMPWRLTEISHLQLASVQWFPLIWWLLARAVHRAPSRLEQAVLTVAVAVQLLSSFYLAYYLSFSCGLLLALLGFRDAARRSRLPRIAACLAPGYLLFGLSALPYLSRRHTADLEPGYDPAFSIGLERTWSLVHPRLPDWLAVGEPAMLAPPAGYDLPAGVLGLALVAGVVACFRRSGWTAELRGAVLALWAVALLGVCFGLGGSLEIFGQRVPLPARLFVAVLPGFEMLRGPVRWLIVTGVALPLLAGIGVAATERLPSRATRTASLVLAAIALAASVEWFAIPARPAWDDRDAVQRRYAALSALPPGPVLEVPFGRPLVHAELGSRALLASTLHWRPLVNGYTGYAPPSFPLVQRLAARLPERDALLQLSRLTGARHFVVDQRKLPPREAALWRRYTLEGLLTPRFVDATHHIYELRASAASGSAIAALRSATPGPTTAGGLPRTPLSLGSDAADFAARIPPKQAAGLENPVSLRVANRSPVAWAGLDVHREGLVLLRYTWRAAGSDLPLQTDVVAFDRDLAPGDSFSSQLWLLAPLRDGPYQLCLDLVQQQGGALISLGGPAVERRVELVRPTGLAELHELIATAALPAPERSPCRSEPSGT